MKTIYVAGFLFSKNTNLVSLIEKQKPDWQKGKWNAIGGKVEPDETIFQAMQREFKEETGVDINDWSSFCLLSGEDSEVHFFSCFSDEIFNIKTMESERVEYFTIETLQNLNTIYNLKWLIPLALDKGMTVKAFEENSKIINKSCIVCGDKNGGQYGVCDICDTAELN